jgi:uridine phosphorylase
VKRFGRRPPVPLLEFDASTTALIEPAHLARPVEGVPDALVICFFAEVVGEVCGGGRAEVLADLGMEAPRPLYRLELGDGRAAAVLHPGIGAPWVVALAEEAIALGCTRVMACGGAGALVPELALGQVVVPEAAVRDEGTSYHYLPPSREVEADRACLAAAVGVLDRQGVPHRVGKTWTTDAVFRETAERIARRRAEGCITVEMEASALFALARHRGVRFAQYLYAGDDLSGERWDHRSWQRASVRRTLFDLALEAALSL